MDLHRFGGAVAPCLALAVAACISAQSWEATRILRDIDARGGPSDLKALTPAPTRSTIAYRVGERAGVADLYEPNQPIGAGLVLVPGFTPAGKNDPRLVDLALSLARARFLVLVPDIRGSREMRIRIEDARSIADAAAYLAGGDRSTAHRDVGVIAISYAVTLAVLATMEPQAKESIRFVVGVGGYYDTASMVTFMTTGGFREPGETAWRTARPNPAAKWIFLASNTDVLTDPNDRNALSDIADRRLREPDARVDDLAAGLGAEGRSVFDLLTNTDAERVQSLLDRLPIALQRRMERLSLSRYDLSELAGRLILIHGRADSMIPYTESLSLAAAVPGAELFVIDGFSHIDPSEIGMLAQLQLVDAIQAVLSRRRSQPTARFGE
jgi:pimeloyl-ACP methyl ester carboxylesterase